MLKEKQFTCQSLYIIVLLVFMCVFHEMYPWLFSPENEHFCPKMDEYEHLLMI